jgi:lipoic acid synthetase
MSNRLPPWLIPTGRKRPQLAGLGRELAGMGVHTVCQSARCPNLGECFARGRATFMILGDVCTRDCGFCAVTHGEPAPPDEEEPGRVAEAARRLGLRHVVVTSVTRDDLPDGGAAHFAATVSAVRERLPGATVETLTPDFGGSREALRTALAGGPDVFNHNVETVPRLYREVRPQADYERSLRVLAWARAMGGGAPTKSGFMVGLGETEAEVAALLRDLRSAGVEAVTVGQYLQPTRRHLPVAEYVRPAVFQEYERAARAMGFRHVLAGPLVRSSYHAEDLLGS